MIKPLIFQILSMTGMSRGHYQDSGRKFCLQHGLAVFAAALMSLVSIEAYAQDNAETCPCFDYEEVESIFARGEQLAEDEGVSACHTEDYSVECNAEVVVWDQDFAVIARASVNWFDFDPSNCEYIDTAFDPDEERYVSWPHPAPEVVARACFNIISSVIAKLDTSGKCETYP